MRKYDLYLYDNLDREYERKNEYLREVAELQDEIGKATGSNKEQLKNKLQTVIKNKKQHPYIKKLDAYKAKEKEFLATLKDKAGKVQVDTNLPKSVQKLQVRLMKAEEKLKFYKGFIELTYDAQLIYEQSDIEVAQIPPIIASAKESYKELQDAIKESSTLKDEDNNEFKKEFNEYKRHLKDELAKEIASIKKKQKDGIISKKARETTIKHLKGQLKQDLLVKSFENKKTYYSELIKNKKHELSRVIKQKINTVNINAAAVRRVCPVETDQTVAWKSAVSILIPGLGQLLNKQYVKAIAMFFVTLYTYGIAIPYALGFGNYRGEGISGLITLAQNGGRLDRSIIFLIEGIIALALMSIAIILMVAAYKDARKVEKERIKGSRIRSWIETKQTLFEDGFPYIVSAPALVLIVFIVFIPIATPILLSFTGMDPTHQAKFGWEGLMNYKMIVLGQGLAGSVFWKILGWTIVWTISGSTLGIALGFVLAVVLNNDRIKGKVLFRSIYMLPWAVPAFISITFFSILAAPNGALSQLLSTIFNTTISIKNDPFISRATLICLQGWLGSSYIFLLATGVLQSISKDLYEAADIDGASYMKKISKITIPLVLFQTAPLLVGQYTFNFNNFSIIYLFNKGGPFNPLEYGNLAGSTDLLISYIYKLTLENQYQALGAAITVFISIALIFIAYLGFRNTAAFRKEK